MRKTMLGVLVTMAFTAIAQVATAPAPPPAMAGAARAFLDSLSPEQQSRAQFPFDAEERLDWFFTPVTRRGLTLKDMTEAQRQAATNLLRTGLSEQGFTKAETIRALEDVLVEMGGDPRVRDRDLYYFTVFGEPGPQTTWGWRYEGHHLSQHWTVANGTAMATTPQFFGANPAEVRQGKMTGTRPLAAEEDLAYELLRSLDPAQWRAAIIDSRAPDDILTSNQREAAIQEDRGVSFAELTTTQRETLIELIGEHANAAVEPVARDRMSKVRASKLEAIKFAWMGGTDKAEGHYYRIQGPTFLIEFDNTQNSANHIHLVWRDFEGDFGLDLLTEHYTRFAHTKDESAAPVAAVTGVNSGSERRVD